MQPRHRGWTGLCLILCAGLIHGLIYVFVVPPWQHNDEPNHFEYVWLTAFRRPFPQGTDFDPGISRAVTESMVRHHFYDDLAYIPDLKTSLPVRITGYSQIGDPPLYYLAASIPLRLLRLAMPEASIEAQLYAARLASLGFLLITLLAAWGLMRELTHASNPVRWLAPLALALWPGFIDLMTAVTNFAGAVAFFSLFFWFGARLIRKGLNWLDGLASLVCTAACVWTLSMGYSAVPLLGAAVLFAIFRDRWRSVAWGAVTLCACAGLIALLTWGDADLWYREARQPESTSTALAGAPMGERVLQLSVSSAWPSNRMFQLIPLQKARQLSGRTVTLGAWMWADRPVEAVSLVLQVNNAETPLAGLFSVTSSPSFYAVSASLPAGIQRAWIRLSAPIWAEAVGVKIYFDGVVLAEGAFPIEQPPIYEDRNAASGLWEDQAFINLVRNPSAEKLGFRIRPWADRQTLFGYGVLSMALYSVRDMPNTFWYFRGTTANLLRTLWGKFGWNHVPFLGHKPYRGFLAATLTGMAGAIAAAWRLRKQIQWTMLGWLILSVIGVVSLTLIRGVFNLWFKPFIPSARYIYPVMPTITFILCIGWWEIVSQMSRWTRPWVPRLLFVLVFLGVDVYALVSLARFYSK